MAKLPRHRFFVALLAGGLFPLGLAPFDLWWLIPVCIGLFAYTLSGTSTRTGAILGACFGAGFWLIGASWVYVSIHEFGGASAPLATALTLLFCLGLALLHSAQGAMSSWLGSLHRFPLIAIAMVWVGFEWIRSWLLTGFPWLYAGYAVLETPLSGVAPIVGVFGASLLLALLGTGTLALLRNRQRPKEAALWSGLAVLALALSISMRDIQWTQPVGTSLRSAIHQPNISLRDKWDSRQFVAQLEQFAALADVMAVDADLLIWPETALPGDRALLSGYLDQIAQQSLGADKALITGILSREYPKNYNSLLSIGSGSGLYHKQKLVPFGEFVPFEDWLRGLILFFDLPSSSFSAGPSQQAPLQALGYSIAPLICYEVVYPDFAAAQSQDSDFLLTVSNDIWFGHSIGPLQHFQMARFRALETGRPLLRGTNNGISAAVDFDGRVIAQAPQFSQATLFAEIQPRRGTTPFQRFGSTPLLVLMALFLTLGCRPAQHRSSQS
jgi:apolipoprotein N-acyltransferase